jgi:hypothetical protein
LTETLRPTQQPAIAASEFRAAMRHLAGAVTVIATGAPGHRFEPYRYRGVLAVRRAADAARLREPHRKRPRRHQRQRQLLGQPSGDDQAVSPGGSPGVPASRASSFCRWVWATLATGAPTLLDAVAAFAAR